MFKLIGVVLLFVSWLSYGQTCEDYDNLSPIQKGRLLFSYHQGQGINLGYTLASIALVESSAGVYRINPYSMDFGLYQINMKTASNVLGITNYYKKLALAEKLIYQDTLNSYVALDVLQYFYKYHKGNWKKMIMSYNNGFKINTEKGISYLNKVSSKVNLLQSCMIV